MSLAFDGNNPRPKFAVSVHKRETRVLERIEISSQRFSPQQFSKPLLHGGVCAGDTGSRVFLCTEFPADPEKSNTPPSRIRVMGRIRHG